MRLDKAINSMMHGNVALFNGSFVTPLILFNKLFLMKISDLLSENERMRSKIVGAMNVRFRYRFFMTINASHECSVDSSNRYPRGFICRGYGQISALFPVNNDGI